MTEQSAPSAQERLADAGMALALALVLGVVIAADADGRTQVLAYVFAVGFGTLLLGRRRWPRLVLVLTVLGIFLYYIANLPPLGMVLPATGALYFAAERGRTLWAAGAAVVLLVVATFFRLAEPDPSDIVSTYGYVTELALAAAAIALGVAVRLTREAHERSARIAQLTAAEQRLEASARLQAERLGIARDLHDTIGHELAVASLHTGVAADALGPEEPDVNGDGSASPDPADVHAARTALFQVREATTRALGDLRDTVTVLRSDLPADAVPGLVALPDLLAPVRAAGTEVTVQDERGEHPLPPTVDAACSRILQESLTNVLRHANAQHVEVELRVEAAARRRDEQADAAVVLAVRDDGTGPSSPVPEPSGGAGIPGMRERAALLGGTLTAGPRPAPEHGFEVRARIPLAPGRER
jgi:signal transduction histidine kinase